MIGLAKQSLRRNSFHFLPWGRSLIPAMLANSFMAVLGDGRGSLAWMAVGIIGGSASMAHGAPEGNRQQVANAMAA